MKIGIVSGYFNPLHAGHVEYINAAKKECELLFVIINSDYQRKLKGSKEFMDQYHREFIVGNLKSVDKTFISIDTDKTQCETLKHLRQLYPNDELSFMNSGDRKNENLNCSENYVCEQLKILAIVLDLPKIHSSSELLKGLE